MDSTRTQDDAQDLNARYPRINPANLDLVPILLLIMDKHCMPTISSVKSTTRALRYIVNPATGTIRIFSIATHWEVLHDGQKILQALGWDASTAFAYVLTLGQTIKERS